MFISLIDHLAPMTASASEDYRGPHFRYWDGISQSQIHDWPGTNQDCFEATSESTLMTREERQTALKQHSDWRNRVPTPFVSASKSPEYVFMKAANSSVNNKRGDVYITVINPMVRVREGLPMFKAIDELRYYGVLEHLKPEFYQDEILYPYCIFPEEIVQTWSWEDTNTVGRGEWLQIAQKAFEKHERAALVQGNHMIDVSKMAMKNEEIALQQAEIE